MTDIWPPTGKKLVVPTPRNGSVPLADLLYLFDAVKVLTEKVDDLQDQLYALKDAVGRIHEEGRSDGRLG